LSKVLVIVRHAHRDKSEGREVDNGISKKGEKQALAVRDFYVSRYPETVPRILSSPKKRCVETVEPLAKVMKTKVESCEYLLEQQEEPKLESNKQFLARIDALFKLWKEDDSELMVVCSHGDWIPVAVRQMFGIESDLKKGGWIEIDGHGDAPVLTWMVQKLAL
jgi:broad specificity phosphatase PhoE